MNTVHVKLCYLNIHIHTKAEYSALCVKLFGECEHPQPPSQVKNKLRGAVHGADCRLIKKLHYDLCTALRNLISA